MALTDWTGSSWIRCRLLVISARAPSPVCASEIPSLALRVAWFKPRIWVVKRSEIAKPAASSLALLMRRPDDRRWSAVDRAVCDVFRLRCEFSEAMFVLMTCGMSISSKELIWLSFEGAVSTSCRALE